MRQPYQRLLELLYGHRRWWTPAELGQVAKLSRREVEEGLARLEAVGHPLEFSPAQGARLVGPPALDSGLIERNLGTRRVGRNVICFKELDSTNDTAAACARQPGSDGLVVLADRQRKGRGRRGRRWLSPPGANVLMSVLLMDPEGRLAVECVTLAAGMAAAEGIDRALGATGEMCRLKWPNDVLLDDKKVAGILVEQRSAPTCVIVGIGVNVNAHPPDADVDRPATDLAAQAGPRVDRIAVIRALCRALDEWVVLLGADRSAAVDRLRAQWAARCRMVGGRHTVGSAGGTFTGRVVEIDPLTGLVLQTDDGSHVHIPAAEASVI